MQNRRNKGITLIELMVVVVIVAILASIAYPSYRRYAVRATRNEAKVALLQLTQSLERCYTRTHSYDECIEEDIVLVENTEHYQLSFAAEPALSATEYRLQAVAQDGQAADDARCATLQIDQAGRRYIDGEHGEIVQECW